MTQITLPRDGGTNATEKLEIDFEVLGNFGSSEPKKLIFGFRPIAEQEQGGFGLV